VGVNDIDRVTTADSSLGRLLLGATTRSSRIQSHSLGVFGFGLRSGATIGMIGIRGHIFVDLVSADVIECAVAGIGTHGILEERHYGGGGGGERCGW